VHFQGERLIVALSFLHLGADIIFCFSFITLPITALELPSLGTHETIGSRPALIDLMKDREWGTQQSIGHGEKRDEDTQQYCSEFGGRLKAIAGQ
jgi:hypothetical protein